MQNIGELTADGYGMMLFPADLLTEFLKLKKNRAKKLISYLNKNKDFFFELIREGKIIPFYTISRFEYQIFVSINEEFPPIPEGYKEISRWSGFYAEVGATEQLCLSCFDDLEYDFQAIKDNELYRSREIRTGAEGVLENYTMRLPIALPQGKYTFDLIGLEKIEKGERESKNYAYAFVFCESENALNNNFSLCDNEENQYQFNLS